MEIRNANDARRWLAAWEGKPREGILGAAIDGLRRVVAVMTSGAYAGRYSAEDTRAACEALEILKGARR